MLGTGLFPSFSDLSKSFEDFCCDFKILKRTYHRGLSNVSRNIGKMMKNFLMRDEKRFGNVEFETNNDF